jgi:uncharacterized protein (TIGR00369 family)
MDLLALGKAVLESQPFSIMIGAQLEVFKEGKTELHVPITDKLKQQHGFVHGGVISYAADNALTFVGGSVLGPAVVTSEYKINYLRPAKGERLIARAEVVYSSKNLAVCRCDIFDAVADGERLCATAQGTISRLGKAAEE